MTSACPTTQHIHAMAAMAAGMGEPSCETIVDGVRITVHVPFEGPLTRQLAHRWIKPRTQFRHLQSFLFMTGIKPAPENWKRQLADLNNGAPLPNDRSNLVRAVIFDWHVKGRTAEFHLYN